MINATINVQRTRSPVPTMHQLRFAIKIEFELSLHNSRVLTSIT